MHNRVESIYSLASLVKKLAPQARVVVGHGQMNERELERVMLAFVRDEADVLVSTTIVENGLDIPRANTIIINRADRFGLSELYQLRGRVGRSNRRAYAYLLVPPGGQVTPLAQRRLSALREFSELGAGFRIAALDLELRGAGNLLGREQHGHIGAVGFDLYCQMMERAVAAKKGEAAGARAPRHAQPRSRYPHSAGIHLREKPCACAPTSASPACPRKTIASAVRAELADRFGPLPPSVENLLEYAILKSACERLQISSVERRAVEVVFKFHPTTPVNPEISGAAGPPAQRARAWIPAACWPWPSKVARPASPARSETYCATSKQGTKMHFWSGIGPVNSGGVALAVGCRLCAQALGDFHG